MERRAVALEELLGQSRWITRLARALVAREADVDDVVQQTWLRALESPPRHGGNVRAWLGAIARNVVRGRVRAEERRAAREEQAPRPAPPTSPEDAIARAELRRRVVENVLALDEPYRSTIVMAFFDEMSAEEIAHVVGAPLETVRTRLKRGLAQLRERLGSERDRDGRPLMAGLLAMVEGSRGVLVMTIATNVVIAASLVAGTTWLVWPRGASIAAPTPASAATAADPSSPKPPEPEPPVARAPAGEPSADASTAGAGAQDETFTLSGVVRDSASAPVADAFVILFRSDATGGMQDADVLLRGTIAERGRRDATMGDGQITRSAADGRYEFAAVNRHRAWRVGLWSPTKGAALAILPPEPAAGSSVVADAVLLPVARVAGRVLDAQGQPVPYAEVEYTTVIAAGSYLLGEAGWDRESGYATGSTRRCDEHGVFALPPATFGHFELSASLEGGSPSLPVAFDVTRDAPEKSVDLVLGTATLRHLTGRLLDLDGNPAQLATTVLPLLDPTRRSDRLQLAGYDHDPGEPGDPEASRGFCELFRADLSQDTYDVSTANGNVRFLGVIVHGVLLGRAEITDPARGPDVVLDTSLVEAPEEIRLTVRVTVPPGPADAPPLEGQLMLGYGQEIDATTAESSTFAAYFPLERGSTTERTIPIRKHDACSVRISAPGFATAWAPPMRPASDVENAVELTLRPADGLLRGAVATSDGLPLHDAPLVIYERVADEWRPTATDELTTDGAGHFETREIASGDYLVVAHPSTREAAFASVHVDAATEPVVLLSEAGVECTLDVLGAESSSSKQPRLSLRVFDADGVPVYDDRAHQSPLWRARTQYVLRLRPGHHVADLLVPSGATRQVEFDATDGARIVIAAPQ
jgi:RNA polymerase sigma-70 factor (ECF subfamily)